MQHLDEHNGALGNGCHQLPVEVPKLAKCPAQVRQVLLAELLDAGCCLCCNGIHQLLIVLTCRQRWQVSDQTTSDEELGKTCGAHSTAA